MAREASVLVGSGLTRGLTSVPVNATSQERHVTGTAVAILNPEDVFAAAGQLQTSQVNIGSGEPSNLGASGIQLPYRRSIIIQNRGPGEVFIGSTSGLTTSNGFGMIANSSLSIDIKNNVPLWLISDTDADVRIMQASQII